MPKISGPSFTNVFAGFSLMGFELLDKTSNLEIIFTYFFLLFILNFENNNNTNNNNNR